MLAARKRDYPEGVRAYTAALRAFLEAGNDIEHAKTSLKLAALILQKNSESERPVRREVDDAIEMLRNVMPNIRERRLLMPKENDEAERVLHALQRMGIRLG